MSNIAPFNRPSEALFDEQILLQGDESFDEVCSKLPCHIDFVLNGSDQHLKLSERLAQHLTPEWANSKATFKLRKDKVAQQDAMRASGMPYIPQVCIPCPLEDNDFGHYLSDMTFPVFAKPVNGGGSIGIFKANSFSEFQNKMKSVPRMVNFDPITHYLVQPFIADQEIIIDSFSVQGKHEISNIFSYYKSFYHSSPVYRYVGSVDDASISQQAFQFVSDVLNVCSYENGFAHTNTFAIMRRFSDHGSAPELKSFPRRLNY